MDTSRAYHRKLDENAMYGRIMVNTSNLFQELGLGNVIRVVLNNTSDVGLQRLSFGIIDGMAE